MRGRAAPPHPGIYRVPPPPESTHIAAHERLSTPSRSTSLAFSKRSDGGVRRRRYILCSLLNTLPTAVRVILCSKRIQTVKRLRGGPLSLSYPRRLKYQTICRWQCKRRPSFSSVLVRKESNLLLGRPARVQESSKGGTD